MKWWILFSSADGKAMTIWYWLTDDWCDFFCCWVSLNYYIIRTTKQRGKVDPHRPLNCSGVSHETVFVLSLQSNKLNLCQWKLCPDAWLQRETQTISWFRTIWASAGHIAGFGEVLSMFWVLNIAVGASTTVTWFIDIFILKYWKHFIFFPWRTQCCSFW